MKEGKVFVDTNILVYAYDSSAGDKHKMAVELMSRLWASGDGIISSQVLQEFFVCVTRKIVKPLDVRTAKEIVKDLLKWKTVIVTGEILLEAIDILSVHKSSFWDSMIIASAIEGGARTILSEDLSNNQLIKGITIRNPFSILK
jgi:predicted nucleic acid-binding protein